MYMDSLFLWIVAASLVGSVFAMIGGALLLIKEELTKKISLHLISFAAGSLLGAALLELIPESLELSGNQDYIFVGVAVGVILLFIFEKLLNFYHCHNDGTCDIHDFSLSVIFGDAFHNFLDGIAIAISFLVSIPTGIKTVFLYFAV